MEIKQVAFTYKIGLNLKGGKLLASINTSLREGKVPKEVSIVVPIPKVIGAKKCNPMRPINMQSVVQKLLKECVETVVES